MFITNENNAFSKKWPSLLAKFGKTKKSNFYFIDSRFSLVLTIRRKTREEFWAMRFDAMGQDSRKMRVKCACVCVCVYRYCLRESVKAKKNEEFWLNTSFFVRLTRTNLLTRIVIFWKVLLWSLCRNCDEKTPLSRRKTILCQISLLFFSYGWSIIEKKMFREKYELFFNYETVRKSHILNWVFPPLLIN